MCVQLLFLYCMIFFLLCVHGSCTRLLLALLPNSAIFFLYLLFHFFSALWGPKCAVLCAIVFGLSLAAYAGLGSLVSKCF